MSVAHKFSTLVLAAATVVALGACSDRPQGGPLESGAYQGKPDTHPWAGDSTAFEAGSFKRGDKASWEAALRARSDAQNEYVRIK